MARIKNTSGRTIDVPFTFPDGGTGRCTVAPNATSDDIPSEIAQRLIDVLGCTPVDDVSRADRLKAAAATLAGAKVAKAAADKALAEAEKARKAAKPGDEADADAAVAARRNAVTVADADLGDAQAAVDSLKA